MVFLCVVVVKFAVCESGQIEKLHLIVIVLIKNAMQFVGGDE